MYDNPDWQRDAILAYAHRRAVVIAQQGNANLTAYAAVKQVVRAMELEPVEFERHMMQIAKEMGTA